MTYADMVARSGALQSSFTAVARIPKPVVAAVTGYALGGGCELALCARLPGRAATTPSSVSRRSSSGVIPGAGGTQRLPRLVGPARAKDIIFTGRFVGAEEALRIGLVDRVVPADEVYAAASSWPGSSSAARRWRCGRPRRRSTRGLETDLDTGLELERQQFSGLFATDDRRTGMESFVEHGPGKATFTSRLTVDRRRRPTTRPLPRWSAPGRT